MSSIGIDRRHDEPAASSTVSALAPARSSMVDNARGIGIVLVVAGHAPALPALASNAIFAFHMPLFFFLSGLMVDDARLKSPVAGRVAQLFRSLLVPYVFFFVVSYAYWLVARRHGLHAAEFEAQPWWTPLGGLAYGTGDALYVNVVLWFFPCLFIAALLHHVARKFVSAATASIGFACAAAALVMLRPGDATPWPWSADCAVVAVAFLAIGSSLRPRLLPLDGARQRWPSLAAGVVAATALIGLTFVNGHVDLSHLAFGAFPILYLPMAALGIGATLAFASRAPASGLARWLSANTLTIFPLHLLFFSVITGVGIRVLGLGPGFKGAFAGMAVIYTIVALLMCWPAAAVLSAIFPWVTHRSRPRLPSSAFEPVR